MAGYIWASIASGLVAVLCLGWSQGWGPDWAYPSLNISDRVADTIGFLVFLAGVVLMINLGAMAERARQYAPPCVAEDGGPLPCEWDGGVTENGYRMVIRFEPIEE